MVDVFISYSRDDADKVGMLARMIADEGYDVWWDADLPPHMSYGDVITAKIGAAKAAVVVWSETAAKSEWVRAEADVARNQKKLIQTSIDDVMPPLPFNQIQCAAIGDWDGSPDHRGWSKVKQSLTALCGPRDAKSEGSIAVAPAQEIAARTRDQPKPAATVPTPPPRAAAPGARLPSGAVASSDAAQAKAGLSTPLIIALGCGGLALLALILLVALAVIGASIDEPGTIESGEQGSYTVSEPMLPDGGDIDDSGVQNSDGTSAAPVTGGDYIPQLETGPDMAPNTPNGPDTAGFVIATVQDPDGYTNIRAGPSTSSAIVGRVEEGDIFTTYQQSEPWWLVQLEDGTEGYIFADRIFVIGPQ